MKNKKRKLKLRKQWIVLVTIICCFGYIITSAFADTLPTFNVNNATTTQSDIVNHGDEVTYQINLANEKEYNSLQFSIIYDKDALEYVSYNIAREDDGVYYDIARQQIIEEGKIKWTFMFADSYQNNDANLGTITFRVKDTASGNTEIALQDVIVQKDDFTDPDPSKVIKYNTDSNAKTIFVSVPVIESSITVPTKLEFDLGSGDQTKQIVVGYSPANTTDDKTFTFTSKDLNVVTVDSNGLVTAVGGGTTEIEVNAFKKTFTIPVTVSSHIQSISLNESNITLQKTTTKEETFELIATINPSNTTDDKTITWESSNPNIATVANGIVTAKNGGSCTITAKTKNNKIATSNVTVVVPAESVNIKESDFILDLGKTKQLTKEITPSNTTEESIWESSDTSVATVENGLVTAVGGGTATITLKVGTQTTSINVTVEIPVTGIDLDRTENETIMLFPTQTQTITGNIIPNNASIRKITWSSEDSNIATINENGVITAIKTGETNIVATAGNITTKRKVKVLQNIESYQINIPTATLDANKNETVDLKVTFTPIITDENQTVTWSSSDNEIASIDASGKVIAKKPGTVTITGAFGNNKQVTSTITVIAPIQEINITNDKITKEGNQKKLALENVNTEETLNININPDPTSTDKTITWTSSNTAVATVTNGTIKTKNKGTTVITATSQNGITDTVILTVTIPATKIQITESNLTLEKGTTKALHATVTPTNTSDDTITWTSSDTNIVSVDQNGTITARNAGTATITARAGAVQDQITVEVIIPITNFNLITSNQIDLLKGTTKQIETEINPNDTTEDTTITWTSNNSDIVSVDETGKIQGKKQGSATIKGTLKNNMSVSINVTVTIIPVNNISLDITEIDLLRGESKLPKVTFDPENTTEKDLLQWTSEEEDIATVSETGVVTGQKEGTTTIKGKLNNLEVSYIVNVSEIPLESMKVINTKNTIEIGENLEIMLSLNPYNTTDDQNFTYKSSDENVAVVNDLGIITGKSAGTTTITITHENGIETTFPITVKEIVNPKTWDAISSYITMTLIGFLGLGWIVIKKKKTIIK